jgi:menaquinone-dependent protoporphyrinogen oxidase
MTSDESVGRNRFKHGATAEIADRVGDVPRERGLDVINSSAERADALEGYDAVILGSAVYAGRWMKQARELADRRPAVWLFSSGPIGDPPKPEEDLVDVAGIVGSLGVRGHQVFAGKIDKSKLTFGERAIVTTLRAPEGDFRDWDQIESWAGDIADTLFAEAGGTG